MLAAAYVKFYPCTAKIQSSKISFIKKKSHKKKIPHTKLRMKIFQKEIYQEYIKNIKKFYSSAFLLQLFIASWKEITLY